MRRALRLTLFCLLLLILVLAGSVAFLLGSHGASRWLLEQVPGLQVEQFEGRLGGNWRAQRLHWQQGATDVLVEGLGVDWSPACLLHLTLCIERLEAERIAVNLAPGETPSDDSTTTLPDIRLPLVLDLQRVAIGSLLIDGQEQARELRLSGQWTASGLQIEQLHAQRDDLALDVHGNLQAHATWPLDLQGELSLPAPDAKPWRIALQISGDVRQTLLLQADSSGYLNGRLTAETQPLLDDLPARAQLRVDGFKPAADLPDSLRLNDLTLDLEGDLDNGYQLSGNAELPGEGGAVALKLQGLLDAQGARIDALSLRAGPQQYVELSSQLSWQDGFSADSHLQWQDFPWRQLYPGEPPAVELHTLSADLSYADGNYLGNVAAELNGPAGAFQISSPLSGDLQQLHLPDFLLRAGQGRAEGQVTLGFAKGIRWDAELQLKDFNPAYWVAELPGSLAGPISSHGELLDERLSLEATLALDGRLRAQPTNLHAQLQGAAEQWTLDDLRLRMGDNRISGRATLGEQMRGQLELDLPRLGQLWPGLQGRLNGALELRGSLQAPAGTLNAQGQGLSFETSRLQRLQLDASLDDRQNAQIDLSASGLAFGTSQLGQLSVSGQGDLQQQRLQLDLDGPLLKTTLNIAGGMQGDTWLGRLSDASVQLDDQRWRLQQAATLRRQADGTLTLGAHCWRAGEASLCADDQRLLPAPALRYRLANFPLDSLQPWLPEDFAWRGQLDAEVRLDLADSGPDGTILIDAGSGSWRVRDQGRWLDFAYDQLRLEARLTPQSIDSTLNLSGPKIGTLSLNAQLDPRPAHKPLSGAFRLQGVELALARPFLPMVEHLGGQLNGSGSLGGTLTEPRVDGRLNLAKGVISGAQLPTQVEDLELNARIAGESLQLDGQWRSGESGNGRLDGRLDWESAVAGELHITGSRLPVNFEPYVDVEIAPDLRVKLADQHLSVSGELAIPRGDITVRELPPSTVKVSPDAQIVGQREAERDPLAIDMDIDVIVGEDRLAFSGFGLKADLAGRIHLGDDLDARGELRLNNGRYRAYGQRLSFRRARLLFAGPVDQPFLDIEAVRKVDEVTVGLRLTGNAEQPKTEIFSEPSMSQEQALSYLVLGRPLGQSAGDNNMLAQAALAMGLAGSTPLANTVAGALGIENFQLDTEGSGVTTSVVASGELSERLSLRYGVGVFAPANTIALRYELTKRLYLEAASGLASSLDLFYRRDF